MVVTSITGRILEYNHEKYIVYYKICAFQQSGCQWVSNVGANTLLISESQILEAGLHCGALMIECLVCIMYSLAVTAMRSV